MKDTCETVCWYGREFRFPFHGLLRALTTEEYADLKEAIQRDGKVHKPVVTDGADAIFDGENRLRIASELGLPQNAVQFDPRGRGLSPAAAEQLARDLNDTGRQDPMALRKANRAARIERVVEAIAAGDSQRTVAEREGVSRQQIKRDLAAGTEETESGGPSPGPPDSETPQVVPPNGEPPAKVKGKDGKSYPAPAPPVFCDRCARVGPVKDCPQCAEARKAAGSKKGGKRTGAGGGGGGKKNGSTLWDWKAFEKAFGSLVREIDRLGGAYKAKTAKEGEGLRKQLADFKAGMVAWHKSLTGAKK